MVTFSPTDVEEIVSVPIINDIVREGREEFIGTLTSVSSGVVIGADQATATIEDDDGEFSSYICGFIIIL